MSYTKLPVEMRPLLAPAEPEIIGYVDPWIVSPGETADLKVLYLLMSTCFTHH